MKFKFTVALSLTILFITLSSAIAKNTIRIVGSSTVYPFTTIIAEFFANNSEQPNPTVEATGTGGGFAVFCQSADYNSPDINDASRPISEAELAECAKNQIAPPLEIKIGFDGIGLVYPKKLGKLNFTKQQLFLALSAKVPPKNNPSGPWVDNSYKKWSDIDKSLPNIPIKVMGPPSTSGTRDTFVELILQDGCPITNKKNYSPQQLGELCGKLRYDGAWLDGSENYNLVLQKISKSDDTLAIVGYNYYENNKSLVNAALIHGIALNKENIRQEKYPLSRALFLYVKKEHLNAVPGLKDFVKMVISKDILGEEGYLAEKGLITLPKKKYLEVVNSVKPFIAD